MKTRTTFLATTITLALPLSLFIQCNARAQTSGEPKRGPEITYDDSFRFPGGTPRGFLEALERHYNKDFKVAWLASASKLKLEPPEMQAVEKALNDFKVDWLSIAEIPAEMDHVRVPAMRTSESGIFPMVPDTGKHAGIALPYYKNYVREQLRNWVLIYNRLGREKPGLGQLVVEGDMVKPTVVMLADKAFGTPQPEVKFKAFALKAIPEKEWQKLLTDIAAAEREARVYTDNVGGRATQKGTVSIHQDTGLLVAHGPQLFVDMVASVVAAYLDNRPVQSISLPTKN